MHKLSPFFLKAHLTFHRGNLKAIIWWDPLCLLRPQHHPPSLMVTSPYHPNRGLNEDFRVASSRATSSLQTYSSPSHNLSLGNRIGDTHLQVMFPYFRSGSPLTIYRSSAKAVGMPRESWPRQYSSWLYDVADGQTLSVSKTPLLAASCVQCS